MKKITPKNKYDLINIMNDEILINGNECNLNHIDTSQITDMSELFKHSEFNGDISQWNVSKVQCMNNMFYNSKFNEDISNWNLISLTDMVETFKESKFTGDLSK